MNQKKTSHRAKVLKEMSKKTSRSTSENGLKEHYEVIREDIIKLRDDLQKGWTMARETLGRKASFTQFRKDR